MLFIKSESLRNAIVKTSGVLILVASVFMFAANSRESVTYYSLNGKTISEFMFYAELALGAYIFYLGIRNKRYIVSALITLQVLVQMGCTRLKYFELNYSFDKDMKFMNLRLNILM